METNEIMSNEEIIEVTDEVTTRSSGKGFKMVGIGLTMLGGIIAYERIIRPMIAKIKAKKEEDIVEGTCTEIDDSNAEIDEKHEKPYDKK